MTFELRFNDVAIIHISVILPKVLTATFDGVPHGEEADDEDGDEDEDDIPGMDTHGVGVDDESALGATHGDDAKTLLEPAEEEPHGDADDGPDDDDKTTLEKEDAGNLAVVGAEVT